MNLEEERDALKRELRGVQEMLAQVLYSVGEPVVVTKEQLAKGFDDNVMISIDDDQQREAFVFSLQEVE